MIRLVESSGSVRTTSRARCRSDIPSRSVRSGSTAPSMAMASSSPKTVVASSKGTPCFFRLVAAFCTSQVKFTGVSVLHFPRGGHRLARRTRLGSSLLHPSPGFSRRPGGIRETEAASPSVRLTSRDYAATTWRCPRPLFERLALITMATSWPRPVMNFRSRSVEKPARRPRKSAETFGWSTPRISPAAAWVSFLLPMISAIRAASSPSSAPRPPRTRRGP